MRILIEIPTWIGDMVMASPSIEKICENYKSAEIYSLSYDNSQNIFLNHPCFKEHLSINKNYLNLIIGLRHINRFDFYISYRNSLRSRIIACLLGCKNSYFFNSKKYQNMHQVEKYLEFIGSILGSVSKIANLKIYKNSKVKIDKYRNMIGINPGAAYGESKCWLPSHYVALIEKISSRNHVVLFGPKNDRGLSLKIEKELRLKNIKNYTNLSGKTNIQELIEIISNLRLFITGDSGPMHIAATFKIPTIAIFGSTKIEETSQWKNPKSVILNRNLPCQPCMKRKCPVEHHNCMRLIHPSDVFRAVEKLLREIEVN